MHSQIQSGYNGYNGYNALHHVWTKSKHKPRTFCNSERGMICGCCAATGPDALKSLTRSWTCPDTKESNVKPSDS